MALLAVKGLGSSYSSSISFPKPVSFTIDLTIPKISTLKTQTIGTGIASAEVYACSSIWVLDVFPLEKTISWGTEVDSIGVYLRRRIIPGMNVAMTDRSDIHVECAISVVDNGSPTKGTSSQFSQVGGLLFGGKPGDSASWGWATFLPHAAIWGDSPTLHLKDDTLIVRLEATCTVMKEHQKYRAPVVDFVHNTTMQIYNSDIGRDFVLVSSEGKEHHVHKAFLSGASPVFRGMFEAKMKECKTGRCEIPDIDSVTLDAMIRFMYLGCLKGVKGNAKSLLAAADKYELMDLKGHCEDALIAEVNMENVADMLFYADKMSSPDLKQSALRLFTADTEKTMASETIQKVFASGNASLIAEVVAIMLKPPAKRT